MAAWLDALPAWDDRHVDLTNQWLALYWALHQYDDRDPRLSSFYPTLFDLYGDVVSFRLPDEPTDDLMAKLQSVPADRARRLALGAAYDAALEGLPLGTLARPSGATLWAYPLLAPPDVRDDLLHHLWDADVHEAARWYPSLQPMLRALCPRLPQPPTPQADALAARVITLPLHPGVDVTRVEAIGKAIHGFFS